MSVTNMTGGGAQAAAIAADTAPVLGAARFAIHESRIANREGEVVYPPIAVALPGGRQGTLPGQLALPLADEFWCTPKGPPPISVGEVRRDVANRLLVEWKHELGPYRRPFGEQHYVLEHHGEPIAVACSGSIISGHLRLTDGRVVKRQQTVELARLARHPEHRFALRAMLRLWRAYLVDEWTQKYWPVELAASYAHDGKTGDLYRFDGWTFQYRRRASTGGGTWSHRPNPAAGRTRALWTYDYPEGRS